MAQFIPLLFEAYTQQVDPTQVKKFSQRPQVQFQRLKELAGEEAAVEIWDAAMEEGAEWEEVCFPGGYKAGYKWPWSCWSSETARESASLPARITEPLSPPTGRDCPEYRRRSGQSPADCG